MRGFFPEWLDPATLLWAAEYCDAMAIQLPANTTPSVAANVCANGLWQAAENKRRPPRPLVVARSDA